MSANTALTELGNHQTLAVVGAAWGDEGKGKIVDCLSPGFDLVARYDGGANAGHTIFLPNGSQVICHQIPSGVASFKECVIGPAVKLDPARLLKEYQEIAQVVGEMPPLHIDRRCGVVLPWHSAIERSLERCRDREIGTTKSGQGPMAGTRAMRFSILVSDILGPKDKLVQRLGEFHRAFRDQIESADPNQLSPLEVAEQLRWYADFLGPRAQDTSFLLFKRWEEGNRILFEGAQATMLDALAGTYPFTSVGMSTAAGVAYGLCLPPKVVQAVLLVTKLFPTRVGAGPMPSEFGDRQEAEEFPKAHQELFVGGPWRENFLRETLSAINSGQASRVQHSQYLQVLQGELGATTGRGRSPGDPDMPVLRYAARVNGADYLALTRLDSATGLAKIPVVVDYRLNGQGVAHGQMPDTDDLYRVQPVYEQLAGWTESIDGCTEEEELPPEALEVVRFHERATDRPVVLVGTGPGRESIIGREV